MLETLLCIAGLWGAVWLAIATVDTIVAVVRREWRFSLRGVLVLMAVTSVVLGVAVILVKQ
jgi:hypothetical protein